MAAFEAGAELEAGTTAAPSRRRRGLGIVFWLAVAWLGLIFGLAALANLLPLEDPTRMNLLARRALPSLAHLLGTDSFGRDLLSRLIFGARNSLTFGLIAPFVGLCVGGSLGLAAGYFRGRFEVITVGATDVLLAFPPLILALAVAQREFVVAARALGAGHRRILARALLPNVMAPLAVLFLLAVAVIIVAEGALSFLGLGVPAPAPSWGTMIAEGSTSLDIAPQIAFIPAAAMFLTVLAFNLLGDTLRALTDPRRAAP